MRHSHVPLAPPPCGGDSGRIRPPELPARRVLPDLLARNFDPVEQRMKQEVEEQAARRRAIMRRPKMSTHPAPVSEPQPKNEVVIPPVVVAQPLIAPMPNEVVSVEAALIATAGVTMPEKRKRIAGRAIMV